MDKITLIEKEAVFMSRYADIRESGGEITVILNKGE